MLRQVYHVDSLNVIHYFLINSIALTQLRIIVVPASEEDYTSPMADEGTTIWQKIGEEKT